MVNLEKIRFIGKVSVSERLPGVENESITEARVEELRSGALVFHVNLLGQDPDILRRGFSLGEFSTSEKESEE